MNSKDIQVEHAAELRRKAEETASKNTIQLAETSSPEEVRHMLHELHVHQIELEMQNDELRRTQVELDAVRERYFEFFNLAPAGYFTISEQGLILEANIPAATMLGVKRDALDRITRFILKDDQDIYYMHRKRLFETGEPQAYDIRMVKKDGTILYVYLESSAVQNTDGTTACRVIISDITARKFHEEARELTASLIELVNAPGDFRQRIAAITASLQDWSGCEAVGIRLREGDDYPYYETRGFPSAFVQEENHLCSYDQNGEVRRDNAGRPILDCMCGNVLCGRFDPSKPFFSTNGSFWTNNTSALLASTTEAERQSRARKRCNGEGYESVALIPLRDGHQVFGLLQFNDHRPDRFTVGMIEHFEKMADSLSIALAQRQAADELRVDQENLKAIFSAAPVGMLLFDEKCMIVNSNAVIARLLSRDRGQIIEYRCGGGMGCVHSIEDEQGCGFSPACLECPLRKGIQQVLQSGDSVHGVEMPYTVLVDGQEKHLWLSVNAEPVLLNGRKHVVVAIDEITERKCNEEALRLSEERHRAIIQTAMDGFWTVDMQGHVLEVNDTYCRMSGYSAQELLTMSVADLEADETEDDIAARIQQLIAHGDVRFETRHRRKDGSIFNIESSIQYRPEGRLVVFIRDITERKRTEEALQSNTALLEAQVNASPDGILVVDKNQKVILANRRFVELLNVPEHILNVSRRILCDVDDAALLNHTLNLTKDPVQFLEKVKYLYDHLDEVSRDEIEFKSGMIIDRYSAPVSGKKGKYYGRIWIFCDITDCKRNEEALRLSEARFRSYFELPLTGRAITSPDKGWLDVNSTLCNMLGYSKAELTGMTWLELTHPDDLPGDLAQFNRLLTGEIDGYTMNKRFIHKDGHSVFSHMAVQCVRHPDRSVDYLVAIILDISELKQMQDELIIAKERAEESDRLKSAFLANMSHEIRTPMNGIMGFTELLKEPHLTGDEQQQYINVIEKSGERMLNIINDIINIAKVESGQMDISISETNINKQIEYIYTFFKPEVEQKGIQFSFKNTLPEKAAVIKTDSEKIYAILSNLVKNAIKFTFAGSIEFGYEKKGELLEFFVKDTGIGIPNDKRQTVFDRFVQLHVGDRRAFQGAGLGLAITKAYVEMLGGRIWNESEEGKGTVFYFTIPYKPEVETENVIKNIVPADDRNNQIKPLKILIAEDDEKSEMLITITVNKFGREILIAKTGIEAIAACRNNPDIDLILMDIEMPEMDGYEAARQIRLFNQDVIIIAQTAFALIGEREKAIAAGCNDYISKPFSKTSLISLLKRYF